MFIRRTENNWLAKWWLGVDKIILFSVLALIIFGIVIQISASPYQARRMGLSDEYHFVKNIFVYIWIGIGAMITISTIKVQTIRKYALFTFPFICFLLFVTLFFAKTKGASRWINLGFMKIQPSEFLKPFFAIVIAMILVRIKELGNALKENTNQKKRNGVFVFILRIMICISKFFGAFISLFKRKSKQNGELTEVQKLKKRRKNYIFLLAGITLVICGILLKQPDVGMTVTFGVIFLSEIIAAGLPWCIVVIGIALALCGIPLIYFFLPHFAHRVNQFLSDDNYQLQKALEAIKESNLLFGGHSNNLKTVVPDIHTDFIFAAVIEETGPILAILLILMFLTLILHILYKLKTKDNLFVVFAGIGITSYITFQILYNLISTLGIGPTKGMTLPFISYGGSSFISSCIAIGIILSLLQDQNLRR